MTFCEIRSRPEFHRHTFLPKRTQFPIGQAAFDEQLIAAPEVANAQVQLVRVRQQRAGLLAVMELGSPLKLRRIASLDRYERIALTKRKRAGHELL